MELAEHERNLLNLYQQQLPISTTPYADMAAALGTSEHAVLETLTALKHKGVINRIGGILNHRQIGASTLVAMAVPEEQLEAVADFISQLPEVNHNYERTHRYNLWFVLTAENHQQIDETLTHIHQHTQLEPLSLPMVKPFHLDLGFPL